MFDIGVMTNHPEQPLDMVPRLSADIARCIGVGGDDMGWREGCEHCLRRTSPPARPYQVYLEPPPIIVFECEYLLEVWP